MTITVSKYQGAGNDFVFARAVDVAAAGLDVPTFTRAVCDRHMGIGADGTILAAGEAAGGEGPLEMVYHNADGSRAPMCGNGIRCFARFCADEGICLADEYPVETLAGTKVVSVISRDPFRVRVDMGTGDWNPALLGVNDDGVPLRDYPLVLANGEVLHLDGIFLSTVHVVTFVDDAMAEKNMGVGREVCHHPLFSEQTNVNFAQVVDKGSMVVRTYERGAGPTLACGTGVCASVVAAKARGLVGPSVDVQVPGGELHVDVDERGEVFMTGGATRIMRGECFL